MTYPWEQPKPVRPELVKDPVTGLYPGQKDHDDTPGFLKRKLQHGQQIDAQEQTPVGRMPVWPFGSNP
jgi:hypothetical protein